MLVNDEQFEVLNALWFNSLYEKKILNSDGQQFHQYQQNEQLSLVITHWTQKKRSRHMTLETWGPGLKRHKNVFIGNLRSWIETSQKCIYRKPEVLAWNVTKMYL
jgi:hypothetical protein